VATAVAAWFSACEFAMPNIPGCWCRLVPDAGVFLATPRNISGITFLVLLANAVALLAIETVRAAAARLHVARW
jgi:hypothetical protein